uniref:Uncharacterized protein n=1 Tax=Panagrolaimus sp. PS1159 TaxID=55785 RepID=A0AC35G635_9BILA
MGLINIYCILINVIIVVTVIFAQERPKILYGLPPLPEDADQIRTTTTLAPIRLHTFPQLMFTLPPMTQLPGLPGFPGPFGGVNPIPELPPIPESRLDGKYDNDGNFVPNSTPKPDKQILENRIHGVKIEPFKSVPNLFLRSQHDDPPRSYANARGVAVVTAEPPPLKSTPRSNLHSSKSSEEDTLDDEELLHPHRPTNARQWQTTATKLVNYQTKPIDASLLSEKSIESIDKVIDEHRDNDHAGESRRNKFNGGAEVVSPIGPGTPKPSNRREILTTKLLLGALGFNADTATPEPLHPRRNNNQQRHRIPASALTPNVVKPQNRVVKPRRPQPPQQQHFFDYASKQRTFQPEQKQVVTKPPQIRQRVVPNRPQQSRPQRLPQLPPQQRQPLPVIIPILPPQPWNRDPQDAAFLHEVEEYDWRLHYKQQYLQQSPPTGTQLRGRAQGELQQPGNPHNTDYEDFVAIRNREYFTDNPPQKNLPLPGGGATEASEVLIPFNNAQAQLSSANIAQTGTRIGNNNNQGIPQVGQPTYNQNGFASPVTQNPLFGGLFNLFNFNGQQGGGIFPGFGRK